MSAPWPESAPWLETGISALTLGVSVFTLGVSIWGFRKAIIQLRNSTYQSVYQLMIDIDRFFFENPEFKPYFYPDAAGTFRRPVQPDQLYCAAEMMIDYFDNVYQQRHAFPPRTFPGFLHYMQDVYEHSCTLQVYIRQSDRERWYPSDFLTALKNEAGSRDVRYAFFPAERTDLESIARIEADLFKPADSVPLARLKEWHTANPEALNVLERRRCGKRSIVGHINILPVRPEALRRLTNGTIRDTELRGVDLFRRDERDQVQELYVESLVIRLYPPYKTQALRLLARDFVFMAARVCDLAPGTRLYALAATRSGDSLLRTLGFHAVSTGRSRVDGHVLFRTELGPLVNVLLRLQD